MIAHSDMVFHSSLLASLVIMLFRFSSCSWPPYCRWSYLHCAVLRIAKRRIPSTPWCLCIIITSPGAVYNQEHLQPSQPRAEKTRLELSVVRSIVEIYMHSYFSSQNLMSASHQSTAIVHIIPIHSPRKQGLQARGAQVGIIGYLVNNGHKARKLLSCLIGQHSGHAGGLHLCFQVVQLHEACGGVFAREGAYAVFHQCADFRLLVVMSADLEIK